MGYGATAATGIVEVTVTATGGATAVSHDATELATASERQAALRVGPSAELGQRAAVEVRVVDAAGRMASRMVTGPRVVDHVAPKLAAKADPMVDWLQPNLATEVATDDTLEVFMVAYDNHRLDEVRLELSGAATYTQTIPPEHAVSSVLVKVPALPSWAGVSRMSLTVRDAAGNVTAASDEVRIYPVRTPPVRFAAPAAVSQASGAMIDAARNRVVTAYGDGSAAGLLVTDLTTLVSTRVALGGAHGLALTPGGDTALVSLPGEPAVGVVRLSAPTAPPMRIPLAGLGFLTVGSLAVAPNGKAFVQGMRDNWRVVVAELDLAAGTASLRGDVAAAVAAGGPLGGSLQAGQGGGAMTLNLQECLQVYDAAADRFEACRVHGEESGHPILAAPGGHRFVTRSGIVDGNMLPVRRWPGRLDLNGGMALSPDGAYVYLVTVRGVVKARTSDGMIVERYDHPNAFAHVRATPDGRSLVLVNISPDGFYGSQISVIDLP